MTGDGTGHRRYKFGDSWELDFPMRWFFAVATFHVPLMRIRGEATNGSLTEVAHAG
jgi:hypothetical protein